MVADVVGRRERLAVPVAQPGPETTPGWFHTPALASTEDPGHRAKLREAMALARGDPAP